MFFYSKNPKNLFERITCWVLPTSAAFDLLLSPNKFTHRAIKFQQAASVSNSIFNSSGVGPYFGRDDANQFNH